ncbi:hypothetical protein [Methanobrevibacter sp.]|uniref:hypothetical protein n=1 Tax=Methanobrevibacter sp. TaxID=66852 RepID=UPI003870BF19
MINHMNNLRRFDFTPECKTCQYRKELGLLEYCCGFVIEEIRRQRFEQMKNMVYNYANFSEELTLIDPTNILFENDTEWSVTLTFKTNLKEDKNLILSKIREALMENMYFNHIHFDKDTLIRKDYNQEPVPIQSILDTYYMEATSDE